MLQGCHVFDTLGNDANSKLGAKGRRSLDQGASPLRLRFVAMAKLPGKAADKLDEVNRIAADMAER